MTKAKSKPRSTTNKLPPDAKVFAHTPPPEPPPSEFDRISDRVVAAVAELNGALSEAHACAELRVFLRASDRMPAQFSYELYRLNKASFSLAVTTVDEVKHEAWKLVSGDGLNALRKKPA